ncbi:MAG: hypothetical protein ACHQ7M_23275, partial [Chloroflexota bacterium]
MAALPWTRWSCSVRLGSKLQVIMIGTVDLRLRTALQRLDAAGRLMKVDSPVDPLLELPGVVMKMDSGPAFLFD